MTLQLNFPSFLNTTAALFIMLALGFVLGKLKIIDQTASKKLSRLILSVAQPALIIHSLTKTPYSTSALRLGLTTFLFGFALLSVSSAIAFFACAKIRDIDERKLMEFTMNFGNVGFIGIPILGSLIGDTGEFMASFFIASFNVMLWTWGICVLGRKRPDIKLTPKKILLNFGTVPSVIGFIIFIIPAFIPSFRLPAFATQSLSYVSSLCTPVSTLIIGALISRVSLKLFFSSPKIYYVCFVKLIAIPMAVCLIMKLCGFGDLWIIFATIISAMPSATTVSMLAELYDIKPTFSAIAVGATSLISIASMPLITYVANLIILI